MVKKLWRILSPFHPTFVFFVFLLVIYEGMQMFDSYVISLVIRFYGQQAEMLVWVILIVGLIVYDEVFARMDNAIDWHIVAKQIYPIYKHLKMTALSKFVEMDLSWHQERNSGALVGKVNHGVNDIRNIVEALSWEFIPTLIQTLLSLIPLIILSPYIVLVASISFCVFIWLAYKSNKERVPLRSSRYDSYEDEWQKSVECVQSIETVVMFGQEERFLKDYEKIHDDISRYGLREMKISNHFTRLSIRVLSTSRRIILILLIWQLYQGTITIADLVFVNVLTERLFHSFWRFGRLINRASEASEGAKRFVDLSEEKPSIVNEDSNIQSANPPIGISMKGVCFSYTKSYSDRDGAIHELDLEIEPGKVVAIVGPSGAGKTTIRKLITRIVDIQSGTIKVGGHDIQNWSTKSLKRLFSFVPQGDDVYIYSASVRDNIAIPRREALPVEVENAAKLAGIHDFIIHNLENGYDTLLGERGKRLSGGQKQRIALARAILANRPFLILDEATNAVDAITEHEIQERMSEILKGKTAIVIAHRFSTIRMADKIVVLSEGYKVEEGTHDELIRKDGLYAKMNSLQTEIQ